MGLSVLLLAQVQAYFILRAWNACRLLARNVSSMVRLAGCTAFTVVGLLWIVAIITGLATATGFQVPCRDISVGMHLIDRHVRCTGSSQDWFYTLERDPAPHSHLLDDHRRQSRRIVYYVYISCSASHGLWTRVFAGRQFLHYFSSLLVRDSRF